MPSALILTRPSYPAMPLTGQRVHQRSMRLGPLVLEKRLLKFRTPTADKDQHFVTSQFAADLVADFNITADQTMKLSGATFLAHSVYRYTVRTISSNVLSQRFIWSRKARDNYIVWRVVSTGFHRSG